MKRLLFVLSAVLLMLGGVIITHTTHAQSGTPEIRLEPRELTFSGVKGQLTLPVQNVTIFNEGTAPLAISNIFITGTHGAHFRLPIPPSIPTNIAPGTSLSVPVQFSPTATQVGALSAALRILSNDSDEATLNTNLWGLSANGLEGSNEPPLARTMSTLGHAINVGGTSLIIGTSPNPIGDEMFMPLMQKAGAGVVTLTPIARYSPNFQLPFGYYLPNGAAPIRNPIATVASNLDIPVGTQYPPNHQTLNPSLLAGGTTAFDPGNAVFGIFVQGIGGRLTYTEDALNAGGPILHAVRIYPAKNRSGQLLANTYIVAFEDASNGDYQDYVFRITNVIPATIISPPPPVPVASINDIILTEGTGGNTNATFTVALSAATTNTVTVQFNVTAGNANASKDYGTSTPLNSVSFPPNTTSATITIPVIGDAYAEPTETLNVNLTSATNATLAAGADAIGVATLNNDDTRVGDFTITGGNSECNFTNTSAALALGGLITFDCANNTTITFTGTRTINVDTTLDGGGKVTINGGNTTRLFRLENSARTFTLQNIALVNGFTTSGGAALYITAGTVNLTHVTLSGHRASNANGAAVYNSSGTLNITASTFSDNIAQGDIRYGGAIYVLGTAPHVNITRSAFVNNASTGNIDNRGGAITVSAGTLNIANSTFANNTTTGWGGAIRASNTGTIVNITNTTFSGNSAASSSAISRSNATVTLRNSIMTNFVTSSFCGTSLTNGGGNVVFGSTCAGFTPASSANPSLGALVGNPPNFPLTTGSPAIDLATNCTYLSTPENPLFAIGAAVLVDQTGAARPAGSGCDSGATEFSTGTLLVMLPEAPSSLGTGSNGGETASTGMTLIAPSNDAAVNPQTDVLTWTPRANAQEYKLILKRPGKGRILAQVIPLTECSAEMCTVALSAFEVNFKPGREYTWRIVAITTDGKIRSENRRFMIGDTQPSQPSLGTSSINTDTITLPLPPIVNP